MCESLFRTPPHGYIDGERYINYLQRVFQVNRNGFSVGYNGNYTETYTFNNSVCFGLRTPDNIDISLEFGIISGFENKQACISRRGAARPSASDYAINQLVGVCLASHSCRILL